MKHLQDYTEQAQTDLFKQTGAFFAFSNEQFYEQRNGEIKYKSLGAGLICPSNKIDELINGLENIQKTGIENDIAENGKEAIIIRELYNHECFYVGSFSAVIQNLKAYEIGIAEIQTAFYKELPNAEN